MAMAFMPGILGLLSSPSKSRASAINKRQRSLTVYIVSVGPSWILGMGDFHHPSKKAAHARGYTSCGLAWWDALRLGTPITTTHISQRRLTTSPFSIAPRKRQILTRTVSRTCRNCRQVGNWNHRCPTTSLEIGAIIAKLIATVTRPGASTMQDLVNERPQKRTNYESFADAIKACRPWMFEAFRDLSEVTCTLGAQRTLV
jgi:hypothetical protein